MNKVYIIIVNFNNFNDTIECLESLLKSDYVNYQVFIIDNSSNEESIRRLSDWIGNNNYGQLITEFEGLVFPVEPKPIDNEIVNEYIFNNGDKVYANKIIIIRAKNNGFAAANNIALRYIQKNGTDNSLIWLLNNDTVVEKSTLSNLVNFYRRSDNKKQIIGSKLRHYTNPDVIQAIAGKYNVRIGKHTHIGSGERDTGQYDNFVPGNTNYIVGASIFLPISFLCKAGVMCEDYFLYFEELDWMQVGLKHGFSMAIAPNAIIYHKEGTSITGLSENKGDSSIAEYYSITNRVRYIKKWYPYNLITVLPGVIFALIKRMLKGKFKLVKKVSITVLKILFTKNSDIHKTPLK